MPKRHRVEIPTFGILILLGLFYLIGVSSCFCCTDKYRQHLTFVATLTGSVPVAIAAFVAARSLRLNVARDRLHKSFEILQHINTQHATEIRLELEKAIQSKIQPGTNIYDTIENDGQLLSKVTFWLGILEDLAIAAKQGYADEAMLFDSMNSIVQKTHTTFQHYLHQLRQETGDSSYYEEFEALALAWKKNKSVVDGTDMK